MKIFRTILSWIISIAVIGPFILFALVMILKVPVKPEKDLLVKEGTVEAIFEGGVKDVCFRLAGDDRVYYINRGLENGLDLFELQEHLIGTEVSIKYPDYWIGRKSRSIHLSILRSKDGTTLYNETI